MIEFYQSVHKLYQSVHKHFTLKILHKTLSNLLLNLLIIIISNLLLFVASFIAVAIVVFVQNSELHHSIWPIMRSSAAKAITATGVKLVINTFSLIFS